MKDKQTISIVITVALLAGTVGYYFGTKHTPATSGIGGRSFQSGERLGGQGAGRGVMRQGGGGFVNGSVVSLDDTSVTIKMPDGGSKIVFYSPATTIMKSATGTMSDLTPGENVLVMGSANADGSVTANSIQLRPASSTRREP